MTLPPASLAARPVITRLFRLQWEEAQQNYVLLYPEGMVKLNTSGGEILKRCNGNLTVAEIIADLERTFETNGLLDDVTAFLDIASSQGWIEENP